MKRGKLFKQARPLLSSWRSDWSTAACRLGMAISVYSVLPACFLIGYLLVFDAPRSAVLPHLGVLDMHYRLLLCACHSVQLPCNERQ